MKDCQIRKEKVTADTVVAPMSSLISDRLVEEKNISIKIKK